MERVDGSTTRGRLACLQAVVPAFLAVLVLAPHAMAIELLTNGGFETGDLAGWTEGAGAGEGNVVVESGPQAQPCARISPNTPRSGGYLFSMGTADGATPGTPEIEIHQGVDVSSLAAGTTFDASAWVSGAMGCNGSPSNDVVSLVLELYENGGTTLVATHVAGPQDPLVGSWNHLHLDGISLPSGVDTVVLRIDGVLDSGFASIDIGVDDVSLLATEPSAQVPALSAFGLLAVALAIATTTVWGLRRRSGASQPA